ncbi:MAG: hypothetical protein KDD69_02475 [Bdellovibrionales bacterium]|nr:hypothetical protein [Bdellovibrionales bacterium]
MKRTPFSLISSASLFTSGIRYSACCWAVLFCSLNAVSTAAAETPEDVLKEIVTKIKAESNTAPIVEYVDWETAFSKAPADQKTMMQIGSPEDLKSFYREMLQDPSAMMRRHVEKRLGEASPDQQAMIQATMAQMETEMQKREDEMKKRISETEYTVGESKVDGEEATVELSSSYQGDTKTHEVRFVKSGEKWLLASPGFAMESKAPTTAPGSAGPAPLPAPSQP